MYTLKFKNVKIFHAIVVIYRFTIHVYIVHIHVYTCIRMSSYDKFLRGNPY